MISKQEIYKKLGALVRVENMVSSRGNDVPNQFILHYDGGEVFQSYDSVIAIIINGENGYILGKDWCYSTTTSKYRNDFLNSCTSDVERDLKSGVAVLVRDL